MIKLQKKLFFPLITCVWLLSNHVMVAGINGQALINRSYSLLKSGCSTGFSLLKSGCATALTGIAKEARFSESVYNQASRGITRELLASCRLGIGALVASTAWALIIGQITRRIYPDYYRNGYTDQALSRISAIPFTCGSDDDSGNVYPSGHSFTRRPTVTTGASYGQTGSTAGTAEEEDTSAASQSGRPISFSGPTSHLPFNSEAAQAERIRKIKAMAISERERQPVQQELSLEQMIPYYGIRYVKCALERLSLGIVSFPFIVHAARAGNLPQLSVRNLILPTGVALGCMAACSGIAGLVGYKLAKSGKISPNWMRDIKLPFVDVHLHFNPLEEKDHNRCIAATFSDNIGYLTGPLTALGMAAWMVHKRYSLAATAA